MACLGAYSGLTKPSSAFVDDRSAWNSGFNRLHTLSLPKLSAKNRFPRICVVSDQASSSVDANLVMPARFVNDNNEYYDDRTIEISRVQDTFDEWILGSVMEIVKNIRQAPLLVQIYANGKMRMEKAVEAKSWPEVITERSPSPDGIILVEELGEKKTNREIEEEGGTRAFGVLIQGKIKGRDHCKSACYLLKTCSVDSKGVGLICSHYCLIKVKNFRESAYSQFNSCWLVK